MSTLMELTDTELETRLEHCESRVKTIGARLTAFRAERRQCPRWKWNEWNAALQGAKDEAKLIRAERRRRTRTL